MNCWEVEVEVEGWMEHGIYESASNHAVVAAELWAEVVAEEAPLWLHTDAGKQSQPSEWQYLSKPVRQGYRQSQYRASERIHGCGLDTPVVEMALRQKFGLPGCTREYD